MIKTNRPMSTNSHPSATANKAIPCHKRRGDYNTNGNIYYFNKVLSGAPDCRFGELFLIRVVYYFDKSQNFMY